MIDTVHIGAGSYPTPPEPNDETKIEITIKINTSDIFPETWEKDEIEDFIKGNIREYIEYDNMEIIDINV